jgi:drug/metabolite transporter (DMT)-like permease
VPLSFALVRRVPLRVSDARNALAALHVRTGGALSLFYALGTKVLSVGDATTLYSTTPLWVALLSGPMLGERSGWW